MDEFKKHFAEELSKTPQPIVERVFSDDLNQMVFAAQEDFLLTDEEAMEIMDELRLYLLGIQNPFALEIDLVQDYFLEPEVAAAIYEKFLELLVFPIKEWWIYHIFSVFAYEGFDYPPATQEQLDVLSQALSNIDDIRKLARRENLEEIPENLPIPRPPQNQETRTNIENIRPRPAKRNGDPYREIPE